MKPGKDWVAENVRLTCWRAGKTGEEWPQQLAQWLGVTVEDAESLLEDRRQLRPHELTLLSERSGVEAEEFRFRRLVDDLNILRENLASLFAHAPHGFKTRAAKALAVDKNTISRWCGGIQVPGEKRLRQICDLFGIADTAELTTQPLFLSRTPVAAGARKAWLKTRIDHLDARTLGTLFPALERLFR
jgi:transcriptional regulator with XRE-family HTH domain